MMVRIIIRFPKMVTRYMDRKMLKMRGCSSKSSLNPRRRNSEIAVQFFASMMLKVLMEILGKTTTKCIYPPASSLGNLLDKHPCRYIYL
jgi:hypothetical protein